MPNLVIVESPAKAKTIGKYLGKDFKVKASMGHLRDLPKSTLGVDIEAGFIPEYKPINGKQDMINELKKEVEKSDKIYLATDPDREGEAISWHLKELLQIPDDKVYRVTFNEITKKVVQDSIRNPRDIDMNLVDAQQARRILDRIVGYQISPLLWRKIKTGLSAGRVQSACVSMVVDRENEIRAFTPDEYWSIDALLKKEQYGEGFEARFVGTRNGKLEIKSEQEAKRLTEEIKNAPFIVDSIKRGQKKRNPAPPFITSTLQQEASRKFNMTARRTMSIAQQLYEGVEIEGLGTTGLITYMRTDSLRVSNEAIAEVRDMIKSRYGSEYLPASPRVYKSRGGAQDAHEAIRPTSSLLMPDAIKKSLNNDQYRLYKLIWSRFVASAMESAVYDTLAVDIASDDYIFRANSTDVRFAGFLAVYEEGRDDEDTEKEGRLPQLQQGERLELVELVPEQHFTQPPPRYTEATLIKAMEENGVGRPSTYAPTITTILSREYIRKDGRVLKPTALGEVVNGLMKDKFSDIVDLKFTANMEQSLDEIGEGRKAWKTTLQEFYESFSSSLKKAEAELEGGRIKIPEEPTEIACDLCGRKMVIKYGRFGRFLACPGYPECKNTKPLAEETPGVCPVCGETILKKKSKNGYTYYGCTANPKCPFMTWDMPLADKCPECNHTLFRVQGRGRAKAFCINEECPAFVPEDERGYRRRAGKTDESSVENASEDEKSKSAGKTRSKTSKTSASRKRSSKKVEDQA